MPVFWWIGFAPVVVLRPALPRELKSELEDIVVVVGCLFVCFGGCEIEMTVVETDWMEDLYTPFPYHFRHQLTSQRFVLIERHSSLSKGTNQGQLATRINK